MDTPEPPLLDRPDARAQLHQFLTWLIWVLTGFSIVHLSAIVAFRDRWAVLALGFTALFLGLMFLARRWVDHDRLKPAVLLIAISAWVIDVIGMLIQPAFLSTLAVAPLLVIALVLPYVHGITLRRLMVACWGVTILIAALGETFQRASQLPFWLLIFLRLSSLGAALALILLLLWQFRTNLRVLVRRMQDAYTIMQDRETQLRTIITNVPVLLFTVDAQGIFTLVEGKARTARGSDSAAWVGQSIVDRYADAFPETLALFRRALAGETVRWTGTRDNRHYEVYLTPLPAAPGQGHGVIGLALDSTERVRAERARHAAEAQLRTVINHLPIIFYAVNQNGLITLAEGNGLDAVGVQPGQLVGQPAHTLFPDAPLAHDVTRRALAGEAIHTEIAIGTQVFALWTTPQQDAADTYAGYLGIAMDITEQKRLTAQFLHAQKLETVGRLAGGIAHDFNNLLAVIGGCATLADRSLPPNHPAAADLDDIQRAVERAANLTRQLLTFARKQVTVPGLIDLNTQITGLSQLLRRVVGPEITVVTALEAAAWPVMADPSQMDQVLMNLAVNARDAMPDGGTLTITTSNVTVDPRAANQRLVPPGHYVRVSVQDTGHGITPDVQAHVFDPFFTTKPPGQGTGLGLATCYGIITHHKGHIALTSREGEGTTVTIHLPAALDHHAVPSHAPAPPVLPHGTETVLLVDDNAVVRDLTARVLTGQGYTVLTAADGAEALRLASTYSEPIHLVITDLVMPHLGGVDLITHLARTRPTSAIIVMSGYMDPTIDADALVGQGATFLQKPVTLEQLTLTVRAVLDRTASRTAGPVGDQDGDNVQQVR